MRLSKFNKKNIFCIEGSWSNDLKDKLSITSALEFIKSNASINFIRKDCSTDEQFKHLLKISLQRTYQHYGIIYFAFHGSPGILDLGRKKRINFDSIAQVINGKAKDKIIHFGVCSAMDLSGWTIRKFRKDTGALAISGYTKDIDFIDSTLLDILYFRKCQEYRKIPTIHKAMKIYYGKLISELGFKMFYDK